MACFEGPIGTSVPNVLFSADARVVMASMQFSDELHFNLDYNSGDTIGIGMPLFVRRMAFTQFFF